MCEPLSLPGAPAPPRVTRHRLEGPAASIVTFLGVMLALAVLAVVSHLIPQHVVSGLPDDPAVHAARDLVHGRVAAGFEGLRFGSALTGEALQGRAISVAEPAPLARAESLLKVASGRQRLEPRLLAALGHLDLVQRRYEPAERRYRAALGLQAQCSEARLGLGVALAERALTEGDPLRARGLTLEAIAQFAAVGPESPEYPAALYDRALLLPRVGRGEEARRLARAYLALDPNGPWADRLAAETGVSR